MKKMEKLESTLGHLACISDRAPNSSSVSVSCQVTKVPGFNTGTPVQHQSGFILLYAASLLKTDEKLIGILAECLNI